MDLQVWVSCERNARHEVVPTSRNDESGVDCHAKTLRIIRNDENKTIDSHDSTNAESCSNKQRADSHKSQSDSRNDASPPAVFARERSNPFNANITDIIKLQKDSSDSIESTKDSSDFIELNKIMDLQVWVSCERNARHEVVPTSRNDGIGVDCHDLPKVKSRNDELKTTSHKNMHSYNDKNKATDSHDFKNADSPNCDSMEIPQQNIKPHNSDSIALIPAYKPTHSLITLARSLLQRNLIVIVVNDGSPSAFDSVFTQLPPQAILLKNAINLGKGAALKNGINYAINHFPDAKCIITLDCDGQHSVDCVLNLRDKFIANKVDLAIGTRGFKADVPLRSKFGNNLTAFVFRVLFGKRLQDTQSGLRAFSIEFGKKLLPLSFNGYEFEMQMLILACNNETKILQVPIRTIYIDNNASSHFNPIFDSLSIYCVLFRHIGNSLLTALIDYVVFVFSFAMGFSLFACMISGRIVAGSFNFIVGKNFVFKSKGNVIFEIISYVLLTLFLMLISMKSIAIISTYSGISEILIKPFCEAGIFAISFLVQRFIIFSSKAKILDENRGGGGN